MPYPRLSVRVSARRPVAFAIREALGPLGWEWGLGTWRRPMTWRPLSHGGFKFYSGRAREEYNPRRLAHRSYTLMRLGVYN